MDIKKLALAIATASLLAACGGEDGNNGSKETLNKSQNPR